MDEVRDRFVDTSMMMEEKGSDKQVLQNDHDASEVLTIGISMEFSYAIKWGMVIESYAAGSTFYGHCILA